MVQRISASSARTPLRAISDRMHVVERLLAIVSKQLDRIEPIELSEQRFNFLPSSFRWRGDLRRVRTVVRIWELPRIGVQPARRYFEVICGRGASYILFQDLHIGTWHVSL